MFRTVSLSFIRSFSLHTQQWYVIYVCWQLASRIRTELQFRPDPARKLSANLYVLLCVQWKTPDDGQRNYPKHVEFHSKNKWEISASSWFYYKNENMSYRFAVCAMKNSWWWTEELSETCRVLFQKQIWEISASSWFYYKDLSQCTVTWT